MRFGNSSPYQYARLQKYINGGSTSFIYLVQFLEPFIDRSRQTISQQEDEIEKIAGNYLLIDEHEIDTNIPYVFKAGTRDEGEFQYLGYKTISKSYDETESQTIVSNNLREQTSLFITEAENFLQAYPEYSGKIRHLQEKIQLHTRKSSSRELKSTQEDCSDDESISTAYITEHIFYHGILMPYFEGPDLSDIIDLKASVKITSYSMVLTIALLMLEEAIMIIQNGIYHLDLANHNFILQSRNNIQVIDFGLSQKAGEDAFITQMKYDFWSPDRLTDNPKEQGKPIPAIPYHDLYSLITSIIKLIEAVPLFQQNEPDLVFQILSTFNELLESPEEVDINSFSRLHQKIERQRQTFLINDDYGKIMLPPNNMLSYRGTFSHSQPREKTNREASDKKLITL